MLQTELITATLEAHFQDQLNDFLSRLESFGVLKDIQYSHSLQGTRRHYSATVLYETSTPVQIKDPVGLKKSKKVDIQVRPVNNNLPVTAENVAFILANRDLFTWRVIAAAEELNARMNGGDSTTDMIDMSKVGEK